MADERVAGSGPTAIVWLERLRSYAPLAATLFGVLYALGFVIVNAYLGSYGIRELDALRTRYVGAGLVFVIFLAVASGIARQLYSLTQRPATPARRLVFVVALVLGPLAGALVEVTVFWRAVSGALGEGPIAFPTLVRLWLIFSLENFVLAITILLVEAARASRHSRRPRVSAFEKLLASRPLEGLTAWGLVLVVLGVAITWAELVYPEIPSYLGGGRPEQVRLVTTQSVADACPPCVSRDVLLLDADEKRIVVLATGEDGRQFAVEIFLISGNDRAIIHKPR